MMEPERMIAHHASARVSWLRSMAIRVNGGIIAMAGLLVGVAAAAGGEGEVLLAGLAGLVAGALAAAMGEYVAAAGGDQPIAGPIAGKDSQSPGEAADNAEELVVYRRSGNADDLAGDLANYHAGHALQVAITSGGTFAIGAAVPLAAASAFKLAAMPLGIGLVALVGTGLLAAIGARSAGLNPVHCIARATAWAGLAMVAAFAIGRMVGTALI